MADDAPVLVRHTGHVAIITLNRPGRLNALNNDMLRALTEAVMSAEGDREVRAMIITGAGRAFCSGADVAAFKEAVEISRELGRDIGAVEGGLTQHLSVEMNKLGTPIVAAINGPAMGVGLGIALACDIRVASDRAVLGAVYCRMGVVPEFNASHKLVRLVGIARAAELVLTARTLDAQEAERIGLVNRAVPHDQLLDAALETAEAIAALPPIAVQLAKKNLYAGLDASPEALTHMEGAALRACRATEDHVEAVNAFLEKRPPVFRGR